RDGECRKRSTAYALQSNRGGQIGAGSRAGIDELAAQVGEAYIVRQRRAENMSFRDQEALHADVGQVAVGVRLGNPVGTAAIGIAVIDVVARGCQVRRPDLMIQASDNDVAIELVGAAAYEIVRVGDGTG